MVKFIKKRLEKEALILYMLLFPAAKNPFLQENANWRIHHISTIQLLDLSARICTYARELSSFIFDAGVKFGLFGLYMVKFVKKRLEKKGPKEAFIL